MANLNGAIFAPNQTSRILNGSVGIVIKPMKINDIFIE